jgi:hypothetical protein
MFLCGEEIFLDGKWGKQKVNMHFDGDPSDKVSILFDMTQEGEYI